MRAVILTPKKEGIVIKNGDPMSSGKVIHIEKNAIIVRLYRLRKDGVREFEDKRLNYGLDTSAPMGSIRLDPGKEAQFPGMEAPADSLTNPKSDPQKDPNDLNRRGATTEAAGGTAPPLATPAALTGADKPVAAAPVAGASALAPPMPTAPAGGAANPPGWPYNVTPPAPVAAPSSGRPGASAK